MPTDVVYKKGEFCHINKLANMPSPGYEPASGSQTTAVVRQMTKKRKG